MIPTADGHGRSSVAGAGVGRARGVARRLCAGVLVGTMLSGTFLALSGCAKPWSDDPIDRLDEYLDASVARQLADDSAVGEIALTSNPSEVEFTLSEKREELDALGPVVPRAGVPVEYGPDLFGQAPEEAPLSLAECIERGVRYNLPTRAARIEQAIGEADVLRAEAAFDAVIFSNGTFNRSRTPEILRVVNGIPLGEPAASSRVWGIETGLRARTESNAQVEVAFDFGEFRSFGSTVLTSPDPAWNTAVRLGITQPLLRGFGRDVALAEVRFARNAARANVEDVRESLLSLVSEIETAYWNLALARQRLASATWLLEVGIDVRDVLERRRQLDATLANYADAVATVERRKSQVIEAQRDVLQASDVLKLAMTDPSLPVGGEAVIVPADWMPTQPIAFDLRESIQTAITRSPAVRRAVISIDDTEIGIDIADNGRLPQLDFTAQAQWFGLEGSLGSSVRRITEDSFTDYLLGLRFEQAIGNRANEAAYRQARLRRSSAVVGYETTVRNTVVLVKNALREVRTNYSLIEQNRAFRLAQAENLRALLATERTLGALTPEFLALKFQRQEGLAVATDQETASMAAYNVALTRLFQVMGTGLEMNRIVLDPVSEGMPIESAVSIASDGG